MVRCGQSRGFKSLYPHNSYDRHPMVALSWSVLNNYIKLKSRFPCDHFWNNLSSYSSHSFGSQIILAVLSSY